MRHHRYDAYSAEQVLLKKQQIYGGAPKVYCYQIFDRKLVNRRFCACAVKNRPKTRLLCCEIAKILAPLWAIAVAEHDGI